MSDCRICAASNEGAHVLKLEGDVRLTMCTALDQYFQSMFAEPGFMSVWVDVTEADGLDSTTLGMLAQLAIQTKERFDFRNGRRQPDQPQADSAQPAGLVCSSARFPAPDIKLFQDEGIDRVTNKALGLAGRNSRADWLFIGPVIRITSTFLDPLSQERNLSFRQGLAFGRHPVFPMIRNPFDNFTLLRFPRHKSGSA